MKKILLTMAALMLFALNSSALDDNQKYLGGYATDEIADPDNSVGLPRYAGNLVAATEFPVSDFSGFDGGKVVAIRFALSQATEVTQVLMYGVDQDGKATTIVSQDIEGVSAAGWTSVTLNEPVTLDFKNLYALRLGYAYNQVNTNNGQYYDDVCYPISLVDAGKNSYPLLIYGNLGQGLDWYSLGSSYGNLSIQAIVQKDDYPEKDIVLYGLSIGEKYQKAGSELAFSIGLENFGTKQIGAYTIEMFVDGEPVTSASSIEALAGGADGSLTSSLTLPETLSLGSHELKATLSTVDGAAPGGNLNDDVVSIPFFIYKESVARQKQLIEHFTSSSCTYCPLGVKLLEEIEKLRDDLAWVSIHGNMSGRDAHNIEACDEIQEMLGHSSWPSASFNRTFIPSLAESDGEIVYGLGYREEYIPKVAPSFSSLIDWTAQTPSFVTLKIEQRYNDDTRELTVAVTGIGAEGAQTLLSDAGLTIYLTEDGLMGRQLNQGTWAASFIHNHTLRAVLTPVTGQPIEWDGDKFRMIFTTELDSNWKRDNMNVIAFVAPMPESIYDVDTNNMQVNNCEMAAVSEATTDIATVASVQASRESIHSISGTTLSRIQRGINIVRSSDGSTRKLLVK